MQLKYISIIITALMLIPSAISAQEVYNDYQGTFRGKVLEVINQEERQILGTDATQVFQTISIEILDGERAGEVITIDNDYLMLEAGDKFYFNHTVDISGLERFTVINIDRSDSLVLLVFIFVAVVVIFSGRQGVRSLIALAGSFLAIFYILLPGLLHGWNPIITSSLVASGILFVAIFLTHGFNRESVVAYVGTMCAVFITGLFAMFAVSNARLSGFASDESTYLYFNTQGTLDFTALLLGAIIIGILGVLDDVAVTQAAVVSELYDSNPNISKKEVYKRAMRVGKEHAGALVNTLVLAYTGASLPLLLYLYTAPSNLGSMLNLEIISTEIVRSIVGSVGLILTVPIVTMLAVIYLKGHKSRHSHGHSHIHTH